MTVLSLALAQLMNVIKSNFIFANKRKVRAFNTDDYY